MNPLRVFFPALADHASRNELQRLRGKRELRPLPTGFWARLGQTAAFLACSILAFGYIAKIVDQEPLTETETEILVLGTFVFCYAWFGWRIELQLRRRGAAARQRAQLKRELALRPPSVTATLEGPN